MKTINCNLCFRNLIEVQKQYYRNNTDGRYSVEAVAIVSMAEVQLPEIFQCEVTIPEANYTSIREYLYSGKSLMEYDGRGRGGAGAGGWGGGRGWN